MSSWDEMYGRLIVFQRANGHCRVPKDYATDDGYRLGRWIGFQRRNRDNMDPERRQRLEGLSGWSWNTITDQWEHGFSRLKQYSEREGHCRVPKGYTTDDGYRLGGWVANQRTKKDEIDRERRRRLEELTGWV